MAPPPLPLEPRPPSLFVVEEDDDGSETSDADADANAPTARSLPPPLPLPSPLLVPAHDVRRDYTSADVRRTHPFLSRLTGADGTRRRLRHCLAHDELAHLAIRRRYPRLAPPHLALTPPHLRATRRELIVAAAERAWTWARGGSSS